MDRKASVKDFVSATMDVINGRKDGSVKSLLPPLPPPATATAAAAASTTTIEWETVDMQVLSYVVFVKGTLLILFGPALQLDQAQWELLQRGL